MLLSILNRISSLPLVVHAGAAVGTIAGFGFAKAQLDASYARSLHPVDFMTGQTTFSGEAIKGYYAAMAETGTLDVYVTTQLIDFGFILAMAGIGLIVCTLIARLCRTQSIGRRVGHFAALGFMFGALSDAIENGWSFLMLANPTGFADWLALPYSGFAVLKFGLITIGLGLVMICILMAAVGRVFDRPKLG